MKRTRIYSGRAWIPQEWRVQLPGRVFSRWPGARVAITGAVSREHARDIMAIYLPMVEPETDDDPEMNEWGAVPDYRTARRMMRRLHSWPRPRGIAELDSGRLLTGYQQGIYLWRRHRAGQQVFVVDVDRMHLDHVGGFQASPVRGPDGTVRQTLVAVKTARHEFGGH
jgi:hypothetical protein